MYVCDNCGNESVKWQGQCSFCKEWNTLKEFRENQNNSKNKTVEKKELETIKDIKITNNKIKTKSEELNNVLGGGITKGSVVLISGEPGIGKSTLTLELANWIDEEIIYVSGEETSFQIFDRAKRLKIRDNNLKILAESNIENIIESIDKNKLIEKDIVLIIDSISVMSSSNINGVSGSISQIRFITEVLVNLAKMTNTTVFIIGHITKDGSLAGPKTLEHMVDCVLYFEGEKYDNLRILRSLKNRFGNTNEVAIFKMGEDGLEDIKNPGLEFVNSKEETIGSCLSITIEGTRALIVETESLTTYTKFGYPKRSASGILGSKLDLILAVLGKYTSIKLESYDVYTNIARGLKIYEPGIDLAIVASIISSKTNKVIKKDSIFIGELSLTGKIKTVMYIEKRIKEATKMGFKKIYIPNIELKEEIKDLEIIKLKEIKDLEKILISD